MKQDTIFIYITPFRVMTRTMTAFLTPVRQMLQLELIVMAVQIQYLTREKPVLVRQQTPVQEIRGLMI